MIKFNLSPSSLNKYLESELAFYYQYIAKVKPDSYTPDCYHLSGNIVHDILDTNKKYIKDPKKSFTTLWINRGLREEIGLNNKTLDPQLYWNAVQRGLNLLKTKYTKCISEEKIEFIYNENIKIKGIIDVINKMVNIVIADWKTSSKIDKGKAFERQGKFYAMLYYKKYGIVPEKVIFEYLKIDEVKEYAFTKEQLNTFWDYIQDIIKEIERKGNDINNYSVGSINGPFNGYKRMCNKEANRRKKLIEKDIILPEVIDEGPYILRDYQKEAVARGLHFLRSEDKKKKNSLIIISTGGGKSLVIAKIAKELGKGVLIFQPSKELLEQNYKKFIEYGGKGTLYSASANSKEIGDVTYATIGSAVSHPELFKDFKYIIVDEASTVPPGKESMYGKFFKVLNKPILGLDATPIRLKSYNFPERHSKLCMLNRQRPRFFVDYLYVIQVQEMIKRGYLCPCKYVDVNFDTDLLKVNTTGSDYTAESIKESIVKQNIINKIILVCEKAKNRKHIVVYVPTIAEAEQLGKSLPNSAVIHSKLKKKERELIVNDYKSGNTRVIINVGVLVRGFDYPEIDMIVLARPTLSLMVFIQSIGRGVRPHKDKKDCLVVDLVGNHERFGAVEDITIEETDDGWAMLSGDKLLTGVPMTIED